MPADVASPAAAAQARAAKKQRRASFGTTGSHVPLAAHSFLLTGFEDKKQSSGLQDKITKLGGHLLLDLPSFQVTTSSQITKRDDTDVSITDLV